jgi:hypothetical protein
MSVVTVPGRGRGSDWRAVGTRRAAGALACACLCWWGLAAHAIDARAATTYVGEYAGHYSFSFDQGGLAPGHEYSDEAQENFSWDVRFGGSAGGADGARSQPVRASIAANGTDLFARAGHIEDPEAVVCTIASSASPQLGSQYFDVQAGAVAGTVDVRAIIPIFTGASGQVSVAPATDSVCAGLDATGAAVSCDPFGCGWECVAFAAEPAFDGAWSIALSNAPIASFPRSFQASETITPCSEPTVSYSAQRSLTATLSVVASDPPGASPAKPTRRPAPRAPAQPRRKRSHRRALHSAGR